jgi:hypothetical protein
VKEAGVVEETEEEKAAKAAHFLQETPTNQMYVIQNILVFCIY